MDRHGFLAVQRDQLDGLLRALLALCLLTLSASLPAQDRNERGGKHMLVPGVSVWEYVALGQEGAARSQLLEVDLSARDVSLRVVLPEKGIWASESLESVLVREEALGGVVLLPALSPTTRVYPPGILYANGELLAWPAKGPLLVVSAGGQASLRDAPKIGTGLIDFVDGGAAPPLANVNGYPTAEGVSLYSGAFTGSSAAAADWPAGTQAVRLVRTDDGVTAWDTERGGLVSRWRIGTSSPIDSFVLRQGEWALLVPPELAEGTNPFERMREIAVTVPVPPEVGLSLLTVPVGSWLLRDGNAAAAPSPSEDAIRTTIAVGRDRHTVWMGSFGSEERGFRSPGTQAILNRMAGLGIGEAAELPPGPRRLIPEWSGDRRPSAGLAGLPARVMLIVVNKPPELITPGGKPWRQLGMATYNGSNIRDPRTGPGSIGDGIAAPDPELSGFWAAPPLEDGSKPWVEARFAEPARLLAVDLIHAQEAGFSPHFNLKGYRLLARTSASESWTVLAEVTHEEPVARERITVDSRIKVEALRLEVTEANFAEGSETARLAELIAWGTEK